MWPWSCFGKPVMESGAIGSDFPPWVRVRDLIKRRIDQVLEKDFRGSVKEVVDPLTGVKQSLKEYAEDVKEQFEEKFPDEPPFTIQRIAELLLRPREYYTEESPQKFLFALERSLSVQSTHTEYPEEELKRELKNTDSESQGSSNESSQSGIVLTQISWVVDTGTPPPDELEDTKRPKPSEGKAESENNKENVDTREENEKETKKEAEPEEEGKEKKEDKNVDNKDGKEEGKE
ncbi:hypothetical protein TRICI_006570 [Trichomonascus ciferrii]|uniref:Uncharacterized protein n=1 Tax=Trichomonascus ciferrii TaxID=44093 RepID=A0A642UG86_9ASCO|nr:hypothetical protein TRICI_006570 [Trichomonascus ciferrii]